LSNNVVLRYSLAEVQPELPDLLGKSQMLVSDIQRKSPMSAQFFVD